MIIKYFQKKIAVRILNIFLFTLPTNSFVTSCSNWNEANQNNSMEDADTSLDNINADYIFPQIYESDYYDLVEFDDKAQPILTDNIIMKVVEDIILRTSTTKGEIRFSLTRYSQSLVDIKFVWVYKHVKLFKTYSLEICK